MYHLGCFVNDLVEAKEVEGVHIYESAPVWRSHGASDGFIFVARLLLDT